MSAATKAGIGIAAELQKVAAKHLGLLPAQAVVDWAREHEDSDLHKQFTWDDTEAAEKWRLAQARTIILRVTVELPAGSGRITRAWVNLPEDRESERPVYRPVVRVLSDATQRASLLQMAKDELGRLRRKYAELTELASVWSAIDAEAFRAN